MAEKNFSFGSAMSASSSGSGLYRNEVEKPEQAPQGSPMSGLGCSDFKRQAMGIAYGQAAESGCKSDDSKIMGQMKNYHWDANSGY